MCLCSKTSRVHTMAFKQNSMSKFTALVCGILLSSIIASAQTQNPPAQGVAPQQQPNVRLNLIVTDEANRAVNDVRQEDLRVVEDGATQTISSFAQEDLPVSYGLIVDTSGSLRALLDQIIETGRTVVNSNRPDDETFIMHYVDSDTIEVDQGWTNNQAALSEALDELFIKGGLTATLDALHRALTFATQSTKNADGAQRRRRALVLITDGEDRGSRLPNPETLLARLRETDVKVLVIGLTRIVREVKGPEKAYALLTRLAQETGGRAFFPKSFSEMPEVLKELTHDLHTQYVISYHPTKAARAGSFRKVQVTLNSARGKRNVITRTGYTTPRQANNDESIR